MGLADFWGDCCEATDYVIGGLRGRRTGIDPPPQNKKEGGV